MIGVAQRPSRRGRRPRHREVTKRRARDLRREGVSYKDIAKELRVSEATIYYWCNPEFAERVRERRRERRAQNPDAEREANRKYRKQHGKRLDRDMAARRRRANEALKREERDREARLSKGDAAEAYSLIRRVARVLDAAKPQSKDAKSAVNRAISAVHKAEDEIVMAIRSGA